MCAIEQAALCRDAFDGVTVVLNQAGPLTERIRQLGLEVAFLPVEYRGLRSGGLGHFLRHVWAVAGSRIRYVAGLKRRLRQYPGILHVHSRVLCGLHACLAGRWAGVPVVLTLHEPPARGRLKARIDAWWIRCCVDEVVAASAATAAEYRPYLKNRELRVVHYCMVEMPEVRTFSRAGKPVVAFIGLVARKRYADFLEACRILKARGVEFEAWLVGAWDTPEDRARAEAFIDRHALGDVVVDRGLIQDMDALYRSIAVVAAPSEPVEALPRVVMEGMSHGLPVVATRVNGVPEMVVDGETGFLIDVGAPESLADRIERLVREPALREAMGRAGRARAEALFAPERFRKDMLAIYRGMVRDG